MNLSVYKPLLTAMLWVLVLPIVLATGPTAEFTKQLKRDFGTVANGEVQISNKYGLVEIKTWEKNRVKVDVLITVNANNEEQAQTIFDRINVIFKNTSSFVMAETIINSKKNKSWFGNWNNNNDEFSIDYRIYMPASNSLTLSNKYGDAIVQEVKGKSQIVLKYCDYDLGGLSNANIELAYSEGAIAYVNKASLVTKYSELQMESADELKIESKYSTLKIDKVNYLDCKTSYDTYVIGTVDNFRNIGKFDDIKINTANIINISAGYTDLLVDQLNEYLDVNTSYGDIEINELSDSFSEVLLVGKYTDFEIRVEPGTKYKLDADGNYADIEYPRAMNVVFKEDRNTSTTVKGQVGEANNTPTIKANLSYGELSVY